MNFFREKTAESATHSRAALDVNLVSLNVRKVSIDLGRERSAIAKTTSILNRKEQCCKSIPC